MELIFMYTHRDVHKKIQAVKKYVDEQLEHLKGRQGVDGYVLDGVIRNVEKFLKEIDPQKSVAVIVNDYPFYLKIQESENGIGGVMDSQRYRAKQYWKSTGSGWR